MARTEEGRLKGQICKPFYYFMPTTTTADTADDADDLTEILFDYWSLPDGVPKYVRALLGDEPFGSVCYFPRGTFTYGSAIPDHADEPGQILGEEDARLMMYAGSYGVRPTFKKGHGRYRVYFQEYNYPRWSVNPTSYGPFGFLEADPPLSGEIEWIPGAEAKAVAHIKKVVAEGLFEVPRITFDHWHHELNLHSHFRADGLTDSKLADDLRRQVAATIAPTMSKVRAAATAFLELRAQLFTKFVASGDDLEKTLKVCGEYIKGRLGIDWHIRGYFDPIRMKGLADAERAHLDAQEAQLNSMRHGYTNTHFNPTSLQPMFDRFPALRTVYHPGA